MHPPSLATSTRLKIWPGLIIPTPGGPSLVAKIVSTFLTSEGLLETVRDARRRLCDPAKSCVVVPWRARLVAAAVDSTELLEQTFVTGGGERGGGAVLAADSVGGAGWI